MIAQGHADVVLADPAELLTPAVPASEWLDANDHARIGSLRFPADRALATASRLLQRIAVAAAAGAACSSPARLRFAPGPNGKPGIVGPAGATELQFNASNTRGLVGCVVAIDAPVGLDVEAVAPTVTDELLRECLDPLERAEVRCLPPDRRAAAFADLWAHKEAYLKALGVGLGTPPREIETRPDGNARRLRDPMAGASWTLHRVNVGPSHAVAVCVPRGTEVSVRWFRAAGLAVRGPVVGPTGAGPRPAAARTGTGSWRVA